MPALQVRDFPADLYERLRESAKREHRSIAQQTIVAVDSFLNGSRANTDPQETEDEIQARIRRREEVFARISELPPLIVPDGFPTDVEIIREMRDSR